MSINSFIVSRIQYQSMFDDYLSKKKIEYIINRPNLIVFRYYKNVVWVHEISLLNTKHGMSRIVQLDMDYILVTHYSRFFVGFRKLMRKKAVKYIKVENPKKNITTNGIIYSFIQQYGPSCYEKFGFDVIFGKLHAEYKHEFPAVPLCLMNDINGSNYSKQLAVMFNLKIVSDEYLLVDGSGETSYYVRLIYDSYDIIDICNCVLANKTVNNIIILISIGKITFSKRFRIPLLITREICRQNNRNTRIIRV